MCVYIFQPSSGFFNSTSVPFNNCIATYPQYCQGSTQQQQLQVSHANPMNNYFDLNEVNSLHGALTAPLSASLYPELGSHTTAGGDAAGNYPCTFHQYSWLKSTNPEFWWNSPGTSE